MVSFQSFSIGFVHLGFWGMFFSAQLSMKVFKWPVLISQCLLSLLCRGRHQQFTLNNNSSYTIWSILTKLHRTVPWVTLYKTSKHKLDLSNRLIAVRKTMMSPYTTLLVLGQNQQLRSCWDSSLRLEKLWIKPATIYVYLNCHDSYKDHLCPEHLWYTWRILHKWSFHMKFIKRAFGEFNKFDMKWSRV